MSCLKDHYGKTSMMRVGLTVNLTVGSAMCLAAIPAVYMNLPAAGTIATAGAGLLAGGSFAKAIQSRWEAGRNASTG